MADKLPPLPEGATMLPPLPAGAQMIPSGSTEGAVVKPLSLGDVASGAAENLIPSALNAARSVITPIVHPVQTVENLYNTGIGEAEKIGEKLGVGPSLPTTDEKYADAINHYFASRYGSVEGLKHAIATDPAGVAMDLSTLLWGGGEALARAGGTVGKIGEIARAAAPAKIGASVLGKTTSYLAPKAGHLAAGLVGGLGTGTGGVPLKTAFEAGKAGGNAAQTFLDNMRGNAQMEDVVRSAKQAVAQLRQEKNAAYQANMASVKANKTPLNFNDIDAAIAKNSGVKKFKGTDLSPETADIRKKIDGVIADWKKSAATDPDFTTPEGMDALKQRIGSLRDSLEYNSPERLIADNAYNAVKDTIVKQAPEYAKAMKEYSEASDLISEVERALSLGKKASADTALRKLQSVMRNNVNTNYGNRASLVDVLSQHGAKDIKYALAGQSMNELTPRGGFGRLIAGGDLAAALAGLPHALAALPLTSPRVMGETSYYLGKPAPYLAKAAPLLAPVPVALYGADFPDQAANQ